MRQVSSTSFSLITVPLWCTKKCVSDDVLFVFSTFGADTLEAIFQNLQKDGSEWAVKQLETLNKMVSLLEKFFAG